MAVAAATVAALTLFGATVFELRSASSAAQRESAAEERLKVVEAESLREQGELIDAYFRLAESQNAPAALDTYKTALASARAFERTHPGLRAASQFAARAEIRVGQLSPEEALSLFTDARSRLDTSRKPRQRITLPR